MAPSQALTSAHTHDSRVPPFPAGPCAGARRQKTQNCSDIICSSPATGAWDLVPHHPPLSSLSG